jgi:hypothetical protein
LKTVFFPEKTSNTTKLLAEQLREVLKAFAALT